MRGEHTVKKFINQHEVILHRLLVKFPKVALSQRDKPVQELKHERSIDITFCDRDDVDILVLDMRKSS